MTLLQAWRGKWPYIKLIKPTDNDAGVLDLGAFKSIEVDSVFDTINHAKTTIGQAVLYRSLACPLNDLHTIENKQSALLEIQSHTALREALEHIVTQARKDELSFYQLLFAEFVGTARHENEMEGYGYTQYRRGVRFVLEFVGAVQNIENIQSSYLTAIFSRVKAFTKTRAYSLMSGPAYITEKGIQSQLDRKPLTPAIIFKPHIFKPMLLLGLFSLLIGLNVFFPVFEVVLSPAVAIFLAPLALIYFPIIGGFDRDSCIKPLRKEYRESEEVAQVLDALGELDALLSLLKYAELSPEPMILPEIIEATHHKISLKNARNPVLSATDTHYVGNDFTLDVEKLVFITGPNSGGKTAFCKTLTQIQLLAQIGSYVPATEAKLTVADKIFYQVPEVSQLEDGEGRFGTELKRTKTIFLAVTKKSLVVLDELSEGTTFEEKMETSANVLNGFYQKGCNTILITHNHQLVDHFLAERKGIALQVEFIDEEPTHKLIPGISRVSHAHRVAKKIGFSKEDIAGYLADS